MHIVGKIARQLGLEGNEVGHLRLAGLLHDVGQYPLSHVIEGVYRHIAALESRAYVKNWEALEDIGKTPLLWRAAARTPGTDKARDKALARVVITNRPDIQSVFNSHGIREEDIEKLTSIITGRHLDTLYGHLLDSDYDCDRFDYVLRDSREAGVTYGLIELDYLIQNMTVVLAADGGDRLLAVNRRKALHALEHYLTARYFMYSQVVFHKTVRSLELLARAAGIAFAEQGRMYSTFEDIVAATSTDEFVLFDDAYFHEKLRAYWREAKEGDELRGIVERLLFRRPLPFVCEYRSLAKPGLEPRTFSVAHNWLSNRRNLEVLAGDAGLEPSQIVVEELSVDMVPFGSEVPFDLVLRENMEAKRAVIRSPRLVDDDGRVMFLFQDEGSLLADLAGKQLRMLRMYVNSDDGERQEALRKALQDHTGSPAPKG